MTESTREGQALQLRAAALAAEVEEITGELLDLVRISDGAGWQRSTASEQWPIGVVAHHVSEVAEFFTQVIASAADGTPVGTAFSAEEIEQNNARHAAEFATVEPAEVLRALQERIPPLVTQIRQLHDDQLAYAAGEFAGYSLTIGQVLELGVIAHFREHVASIRAALAEPA
jgi:hypothetical protein